MDEVCRFPQNAPLTAYCKGCKCRRCLDAQNARSKRWADKNKEKYSAYQRDWWIRRAYGVSQEHYLALLKGQGGRCKICGGTDTKNKKHFQIDHEHTSGKVRGLLCVTCNSGLGNFKDNIETLKSAIKYLENNNE